MKALSLIQPWASLLASGEKKIETRSWQTHHRGLIAIHASKGIPMQARNLCRYFPFNQVLTRAGYRSVGFGSSWKMILPVSAIIGICTLYDVRPIRATELWVAELSRQERAFGDYGPNRFGWFVRDAVMLCEPIPCKGALGLWEVGTNIAVEIHEQVKAKVG